MFPVPDDKGGSQQGAILMGPLNRVLNRLVGYRSTRTFAKHSRGKVALLHNSGFFSNCSTLLMSVAQAEIHPVRIDVTSSFTHFAEPGSSFDWNRYFSPPPGIIRGCPTRWPRSRVAKRLPHHSTYKLLDFPTITDITDNYFQLSTFVQNRAEEIHMSHLPVPIDQVLVVCLRGTDKGTEVRQSPIDAYVRRAKKIMEDNENLRVWIQTDQTQIRDILLDQLGPRSFSLNVLPVTDDSQVIHKSEVNISKDAFSRDLLATTWLMAQAHAVITYTGNVGYWIAIFRGNAKKLYQLR